MVADDGLVRLVDVLAAMPGHLGSPEAQAELDAAWMLRPVSGAELLEPGQRRLADGSLILAPWGLEGFGPELERAAAVVVDEARADQARELLPGIPVLIRASWTAWGPLLLELAALLDAERQSRISSLRASSLMELAGTVRDLTGSSVTIEDRGANLLAYSATSPAADALRLQTILERAVPSWRLEELERTGFLRLLRRAEDVIVRPAEDGAPARIIMPIRIAGRMVGSLWATESETSSVERISEVLRDAARVAGPIILRDSIDAGATEAGRRRALHELVAGRADLHAAAQVLGISDAQAFFAVGIAAPASSSARATARFFVRSVFPQSLILERTGHDLAIVPASHAGSGRPTARLREQLAAHGAAAERARLAVSELAPTLAGASRAAREAELLLALATDGRAGPAVVDVGSDPAALRLVELAADLDERGDGGPFVAPFESLAARDAARGGDLAETLRAYVSGGTIADVARALSIQGNSLRYRLDRIGEIIGFDPTVVDGRAALLLGLRIEQVRRFRGKREGSGTPLS